MLSFEDDTPAIAPALGLQMVKPSPQPAAAPAPVKEMGANGLFTRVKAEDKRVINARTDVNQLVPFKYKWRGRSTSRAAPTTGCRRK